VPTKYFKQSRISAKYESGQQDAGAVSGTVVNNVYLDSGTQGIEIPREVFKEILLETVYENQLPILISQGIAALVPNDFYFTIAFSSGGSASGEVAEGKIKFTKADCMIPNSGCISSNFQGGVIGFPVFTKYDIKIDGQPNVDATGNAGTISFYSRDEHPADRSTRST